MRFSSDDQRKAIFAKMKPTLKIGFKSPELVKFKTKPEEEIIIEIKDSKDWDVRAKRALEEFDESKFSESINPEKIALRRFGKQYLEAPKIGSGRDRDVYAMDEQNVLKVAKSPEGLVQNEFEGDYVLEFLPKLEESGEDYVLVERADKDLPRTRKFLKPMVGFGYVDSKPYGEEGQRRLHEFHGVLKNMDKEYGTNLSDIVANYDFEYRDFTYPGNWGWKDGMPKLVDAGSINKDALKKLDKKNYSDPYISDWRDILAERRRAKKELESVAKEGI